MTLRMVLLLNAVFMFIFASIFLILSAIIKKISENRIKNFQGEVEGEVLEVINAGKGTIFGKFSPAFVVYQYKVNNHKYIVKPYVFFKSAAVNKKYYDTENVTCITYRGYHGMSKQTKYREGESIIVKYNPENPKKHEILNDKDKMFAYKGFKIAGSIIMVIPVILVIISIFVKG